MKQADFGVIFDMDGVLLDTEPLWGASMMEVAVNHGVQLSYEDLRFTTGLRIHEVTAYWADRFPWSGTASADEIAEDILDHIIGSAQKNARVMPGIVAHLEYLKSQQIPIGLATSSPFRMADALIRHFGIADYFDNVSTGDQCTLGKPHPEVYLKCAAALGQDGYNCIAIEDSVNGMVSAKAARMKVIAIPEMDKLAHPAFGLADVLIASMEDFALEDWRKLAES